jgi:hypothetical protein
VRLARNDRGAFRVRITGGVDETFDPRRIDGAGADRVHSYPLTQVVGGESLGKGKYGTL